MPSVETAKNIADVFDVSLDYLVGDVLKPSFDKRMIERLEDFELLTLVKTSIQYTVAKLTKYNPDLL